MVKLQWFNNLYAHSGINVLVLFIVTVYTVQFYYIPFSINFLNSQLLIPNYQNIYTVRFKLSVYSRLLSTIVSRLYVLIIFCTSSAEYLNGWILILFLLKRSESAGLHI